MNLTNSHNSLYNTSVIIIPIYKSDITEYEIISLKQCSNILSSYLIVFIGPEKLDYSPYLTIIPSAKIEFFNVEYFESTKTYNRLMLSLEFYQRFQQYKYILIYQTDAFVFKDELEYWCNKNLDYIGSPWFKNFSEANKFSDLPWGVGNGGFSLRKVKSFIDILSEDRPVNNQDEILKKYIEHGIKNKIIKFPETLLKLIGIKNGSKKFIENFPVNEDYFWGHYASKINNAFKVAQIDDATKFAFECSPSKLYDINNNKLPFGCHAWWKYDLEFWKPHFRKFGFQL